MVKKEEREELARVRALSREYTEARLEYRRTIGDLKDEVKQPLPEALRVNISPTVCEVIHESYQDLFAAARYIIENTRKLPGLAERDFKETLEKTIEAIDFMIEDTEGLSAEEITGQLRAARKSLEQKRKFGGVTRKVARFVHGASSLYLRDMDECLYNVDLGHAIKTQGHEFRRECERRFPKKKKEVRPLP